MNAQVPEDDQIIEQAIVEFTDGLPAVEFDRVEFLPDGRLKATLTTDIVDVVDDDRKVGTVTEVAFYAATAWKSVRPQPRGALLVEPQNGSTRTIASGIPQSAARQHIEDWLQQNRLPVVSPELGRTDDLFSTVFTAYDRAGDMTDARSQKVRFRWVWPPNHGQPLENRATGRPQS